ncbi:uncharacterized protein JCM10292_005389 [Rhodotorula paludigena]|uniref:uncharacterized protein n=1 Tax=Rhodotorula paludigena TaxID=86838 RepID=UPI003181A6C8
MSWTASGTTGYNYGYWGGGDGGDFSSSWVTWVSIVVVAGVVIALLCSRYFYIRRYYVPSFRAYFVPAKGIHIAWLGLHVHGAPARIPREPPPSYSAYGMARRRRRGRQTVGDTVGEGGARFGGPDEDDGWDLDTAERGLKDELPRYYVDVGLPGYSAGGGSGAEAAERIRRDEGEDSVALPSAAEYEAASRASRAGVAEPVYPPTAHLAPSATLDAPQPATPQPPFVRSPSLLSAFRLGSSPAPPSNLRPYSRPSTSLADNAGLAFESDSARADPPVGTRRRTSTDSSSSCTTKCEDAEPSTSSSGQSRRKLDITGEASRASTSGTLHAEGDRGRGKEGERTQPDHEA